FMFSASLLVCCLLLQRNLATTEGHHGTNRHVFYAIQMKGGTETVRALAEQHELEFIQRVSACLKLLSFPPPMWPQLQNPHGTTMCNPEPKHLPDERQTVLHFYDPPRSNLLTGFLYMPVARG
ncbi:hypothetical protein GOODEAATRI_026232, partial [Goodea atripinnis]